MKILSISLSQNFDYSDPNKRVAVVEFSNGGTSLLSDAFGHSASAKHSFRIADEYLVTKTNEDGIKVCDKSATLEKWKEVFNEQWKNDTDGIRTKCEIFNFALSELDPSWVSFTPADNIKRTSRSVVSWDGKDEARAYARRQIQQNIDKKLVKVELRSAENE